MDFELSAEVRTQLFQARSVIFLYICLAINTSRLA